MKEKGFTLIELLVVVAIVAILTTIAITSLKSARLKAKDAGVSQVLSNYRTEIELVSGTTYPGYVGLCSSPSFLRIVSYVESQGGTMESCENDLNTYRIIVGLPSAFAQNLHPTVYAAGEDGFCINHLGEANLIYLADIKSLVGCKMPAQKQTERGNSDTKFELKSSSEKTRNY